VNPRVTVIIATKNRVTGLLALLRDLEEQTLSLASWNVVVVDDGSEVPVAETLDARLPTLNLQHIRTTGVGQSAARKAACALADGEVLVFLDDDMRVAPDFLEAHLSVHADDAHVVVLGRIAPAPSLTVLPLFEQYHARQLERWHDAMVSGSDRPRGTQLCMGNVSMTRADFESVGGFDPTLLRSEDRELGVRLEQAGCVLRYGAAAVSTHCSDHGSLDVWLRRAYLYGRYDHKISQKHPQVADANPWRFWSLVNPLSKPLLSLVMRAPWLGRPLSRTVYAVASGLNRIGVRHLAVTLTALVYALEYFRGLKEEIVEQRGPGPLARCRQGIRADYDQMRRVRAKYHGDVIGRSRLAVALVQRVGLQMLAWYRVMRCLDEWHVPLAPMVISRIIRHLYGAEIHWKAQIAPGVSIVHGTGLVISHAARVDAGCILFQNVTLGESVEAVSGLIGAPHLRADVHVGPGASLLGPIVVGARTKIGAGAVLMQSVAAGSLVMPAQAVITSRQSGPRAVTREAVGA
jgi:serine acetyltransferase/glycosyltransferase involved in cell wall biosynthesis